MDRPTPNRRTDIVIYRSPVEQKIQNQPAELKIQNLPERSLFSKIFAVFDDHEEQIGPQWYLVQMEAPRLPLPASVALPKMLFIYTHELSKYVYFAFA